MRRLFSRLVILGGALGAAFLLRRYLEGQGQPAAGSVEVVLEDGTTVEPDATTAREFVEIAQKVLETGA